MREMSTTQTVPRPPWGWSPSRALAAGYALLIVIGWLLLCLPWSTRPGVDADALDHLFTAASAVSTTGLATVSTPGTYTVLGQILVLLLIQIGGIGYMAVGSFVVLARGRPLSAAGEATLDADLARPPSFDRRGFVQGVVLFTLTAELAGTLALWPAFAAAGIDAPLWQALFHSVSAFCTAGFSLLDDSLVSFQDDVTVNLVVAALAYGGAIGFIVAVDVWRTLRGHTRALTRTSKIILQLTALLSVVGTAGLMAFDGHWSPDAPLEGRLLVSGFQAMSAMTTVGFNTLPLSEMSQAALMVVMVLMFVGASPSGTGGGVKTTTITATIAMMRSVLSGGQDVTHRGQAIPMHRVLAASASVVFYASMLLAGVFLLTVTDEGPLLPLAFEAASALGTVGLSLSLTGALSPLGQIVVIALMFAGRLGPMTFGAAMLEQDEAPASADVDIVV